MAYHVFKQACLGFLLFWGFFYLKHPKFRQENLLGIIYLQAFTINKKNYYYITCEKFGQENQILE